MRNPRILFAVATVAVLALQTAGTPAACGQAPGTAGEFSNARRPNDASELRFWIGNMRRHGFTLQEMRAATGLPDSRIQAAISQLPEESELAADTAPLAADRLLVLPYPGGRHPRIGFLEGAVDPQRETKVSVFCPWDEVSYVVVDVPEAIWFEQGERRELLYLAHSHIPTIWDRQNVALKRLEWHRGENGILSIRRDLPNGVSFGAQVVPRQTHVDMELWISNESAENLTGLRVQNCVMLKAVHGFSEQTNENKRLQAPFAVCHDKQRRRWIITAWENCVRAWANEKCPCLHSDPQFDDCAVGETKRLRGRLWFYEGREIDSFLRQIAATNWLSTSK